MRKQFYLLCVVLGVFVPNIYSQDSDTIKTIDIITDSMTVDPDNNAKWRVGEAIYPSKPKDAWELGVHFGHFFISGDTDMAIPGGYGLGLHLRKSIHYAFSIRADVFYGKASGFDPQPSKHSSLGGGLIEPTFSSYNPSLGLSDGEWFPKYQTRQVYGAIQGVLNIGNILFHKHRNTWNWYMVIGAGFANHQAKLDLLDENGNPYTNLRQSIGWTNDKFNTKAGRAEIKDALNEIYDGDYETEGFKKSGIFRLGDDINFHVVLTTSMGISRKISKRFNIGIEHQVMLQDNDYLDGIKFRTAVDQTNNADIAHYTNIRLSFNLGDFNKRTEPLYWLNPLSSTLNDISDLKQRPICDFTDSDNDGVINILDEEPNTIEGFPVSTRGVTLDSDGDSFPDGIDHEIYSPRGFKVDTVGIAIVPTYTTVEDVIALIEQRTVPLAAKIEDCCCKCEADVKVVIPKVYKYKSNKNSGY